MWTKRMGENKGKTGRRGMTRGPTMAGTYTGGMWWAQGGGALGDMRDLVPYDRGNSQHLVVQD